MSVQLKEVKGGKNKENIKENIIATILAQRQKEREEQMKRELEALRASLEAQGEETILLYSRLSEIEAEEKTVITQIEAFRQQLITLTDEKRLIKEKLGIAKIKNTTKTNNYTAYNALGIGTNGWGPYVAYNSIGTPYSRQASLQQYLYGNTIGAGGSAKEGRLTCSEFRQLCEKHAGSKWGEFEKVKFDLPLANGKTFFVHLRKEGN